MNQLLRHEGLRLVPYMDTTGHLTIGVGHNLSKPISHRAAMLILEDDIADAKNDCLHAFPWFVELNEQRQAVIINMCFNLGLSRLKKFAGMLKAIELGDYDKAADEMLDSLWTKQVGKRAVELAAIMRGLEG
jgi:lysozyme